MQAFEETYD